MRQLRGFSRLAAVMPIVTTVALAACGSSSDSLDPDGTSRPAEDSLIGAKPGDAVPGQFSAPPSEGEGTDGEPAAPLNPNDKEGETCLAAGQEQRCFVGDPAKAGVGLCTWGTQTCEGKGEFSKWGPCVGSAVKAPRGACAAPPDAQGDVKSPGRKQTAPAPGGDQNPRPSGSPGTPTPARQALCQAAGRVAVTGVTFRAPNLFNIPPAICSGSTQCGALTSGGTFTANCAGTYQVCARVPSTRGCEVASNLCVPVTVPRDGATVALPPMPGFGPVTNACLSQCFSHGAQVSVSLDVSGRTNDGVLVQVANVATNINSTTCRVGNGNGGGGGGNF